MEGCEFFFKYAEFIVDDGKHGGKANYLVFHRRDLGLFYMRRILGIDGGKAAI